MVGFSPDGAKRVAAATQTVERWSKNSSGRPRFSNGPTPGRWAKIKNGENGKYSWVSVKLGDDGFMEEDEAWGKGDHTKDGEFAVEAQWRSKFVPNGSIVWITPGPGRDCFLFEYAPGILICRLPASTTISRRQDFGASSRPGSGTVEILKVNNGANPDTDLDDEFEGTGTTIKVFNWTKTAIGGSTARPVIVEFGTGGRFWLIGDEC